MSRKYDRTLQVNRRVLEILNDQGAINYLSQKLIRRRPRYFPRFLWRILLSFVLAPDTKQPHV
jgi:hypothetical protein